MSRFVYAEPKHQVDIIDGAESLRTILEKRVFIGGDLRRFVVQVNDCMATPMAEDPSWQFSANGEVFLVNEPLRLVRVVGSTSSAVDMGMLYNFALQFAEVIIPSTCASLVRARIRATSPVVWFAS